MDIKTIIRDNTVRFLRYRAGIAWYGVSVRNEGDFMFPVPIDDIGDATLEADDKAILFMRYIRRAIAEGTFVRAN